MDYLIVNVSKIYINDPCRCDSAIVLTDDQAPIATRLTSAITKEDLLEMLENETYCHFTEEHEKWRWAHPREFCSNGKDRINRNKNIGRL